MTGYRSSGAGTAHSSAIYQGRNRRPVQHRPVPGDRRIAGGPGNLSARVLLETLACQFDRGVRGIDGSDVRVPDDEALLVAAIRTLRYIVDRFYLQQMPSEIFGPSP